MINEPLKYTYTFLEYEIIPSERVVLKSGVPLKVSKKCFDILCVLVKSNGDVIHKEELIKEVWPNQIVTDAALNKLIMRLRQTLEDQNSKDSIIETVRGIGIKLIPMVEKNLEAQKSNKKNNSSHLFIFSIIALLLTVVSIGSFNKKDAKNQAIINTTPPIETINLAIIPAINMDDWLNVGGLKYLSKELELDNQIHVISPELSWFSLSSPNSLGIELTQSDNVNYALMVKNQKQGDIYSSNLVLRSSAGIIAKTEIKTTSMNAVFDQAKVWVFNQLSLSTHRDSVKNRNQLPTTDFALENLIRGWAAVEKNEFSKATLFLQAAIEDDPKLYQAWILLALTKSRSGEYQAALALVDTLLQIKHLDSELFSNLYAVKADALISLSQLEEAQVLLDQAMTFAEKSESIKAQIFVLSIQSILYSNKSKPDQKLVATIEKELKLIQRYYPLPLTIARLKHNLGSAYWLIDEPDQAKIYLEQSIQLFKQTNNNIGQVSAYIKLSDMAYYEGQSSQALLLLEKVSHLIEAVENPVFKAEYLMAKSQNQAELGLRQAALKNLDLLNELGRTYGSQRIEIYSHLRRAVLYLSYKDYQLCKQTITTLLNLINNNNLELINFPEIAALDIFVTAYTEAPDVSRTKLNNYLKDSPQLNELISAQIDRAEAQILYKEGFAEDAMQILEKLIEDNLSKKLILDANQHGYELLDMQWKSNSPAYEVTLNKIQALTHFDYPILKYQAKYHFSKKNFIEAATLMRQLKSTAHSFWGEEEQLLLEKYQQKVDDL